MSGGCQNELQRSSAVVYLVRWCPLRSVTNYVVWLVLVGSLLTLLSSPNPLSLQSPHSVTVNLLSNCSPPPRHLSRPAADTPSPRSSCHLRGPLSFTLPVSPAKMSFTSATSCHSDTHHTLSLSHPPCPLPHHSYIPCHPPSLSTPILPSHPDTRIPCHTVNHYALPSLPAKLYTLPILLPTHYAQPLCHSSLTSVDKGRV